MGGRWEVSVVGVVSSVHRAWKIGHAMSGSLAPRSARRSSEMLDCSGIGRVCF